MASRSNPAFRPSDPWSNPTLTMVATVGRSNVDLGIVSSEYRIYNAGPAVAFVQFGKAPSVAASTGGSMPVPPGAVEFFRPPAISAAQDDYWLSAITLAGTATIYITPGEGA